MVEKKEKDELMEQLDTLGDEAMEMSLKNRRKALTDKDKEDMIDRHVRQALFFSTIGEALKSLRPHPYDAIAVMDDYIFQLRSKMHHAGNEDED